MLFTTSIIQILGLVHIMQPAGFPLYAFVYLCSNKMSTVCDYHFFFSIKMMIDHSVSSEIVNTGMWTH